MKISCKNIRRFFYTAFLFLMSQIACRENSVIISGKRYFTEPERGNWREYSMQIFFDRENKVTVTGSYHFKRSGHGFFPVLYNYSQEGIGFLFLADSLDAEQGDFVTVTGQLIVPAKTESASLGRHGKELTIEHMEIVQPTHEFIEKARSDYARYRNKIQSRAQNGSRLQLAITPVWRLVVNEDEEHIIVTSEQQDLMWEWGLDFVYNRQTKNLLAIYHHQWFKGE